jgi:hypothetical protein
MLPNIAIIASTLLFLIMVAKALLSQVYDTDFRECPCAAVDTPYPMTQRGADTPGPFIVPANASRITMIKIVISGIVSDVVTGTTCAIHMTGGGLKSMGYGWFVGPLCSQSGAAATSGGFDYKDGMVYKTNIGVNPGQTINIDAFVNGEDMGTAHMLVLLEFDGVPGQITDGDYREDDIGAAANTPVSLTHRGAAVDEGDFNTGGRTICEVVFGAALDPTGDAAAGLVFAPALILSGSGLVSAGNYAYLGPAGPTQPDTDVSGNQSVIVNPARYITNILTKISDRIRAQGQNIESINPGHAIVGLLFK